jgi:hypothetical protein
MTPKEEAKELVDKMTVVGLQMRSEGIQFAIIAIEFAREQFNKYCLVEVVDDDHFDVLRQEIEKLQ